MTRSATLTHPGILVDIGTTSKQTGLVLDAVKREKKNHGAKTQQTKAENILHNTYYTHIHTTTLPIRRAHDEYYHRSAWTRAPLKYTSTLLGVSQRKQPLRWTGQIGQLGDASASRPINPVTLYLQRESHVITAKGIYSLFAMAYHSLLYCAYLYVTPSDTLISAHRPTLPGSGTNAFKTATCFSQTEISPTPRNTCYTYVYPPAVATSRCSDRAWMRGWVKKKMSKYQNSCNSRSHS